jgi:hypothetical protein
MFSNFADIHNFLTQMGNPPPVHKTRIRQPGPVKRLLTDGVIFPQVFLVIFFLGVFLMLRYPFSRATLKYHPLYQ